MDELITGYSSPRYAAACEEARGLSIENPTQTARVMRTYYDPDDVNPPCFVTLGPGLLANGSVGEVGDNVMAIFWQGKPISRYA